MDKSAPVVVNLGQGLSTYFLLALGPRDLRGIISESLHMSIINETDW